MSISVFRNYKIGAGKTEYVAAVGEKVNCFDATSDFMIKVGNHAFSYMEKGLVIGTGEAFSGFYVQNNSADELVVSFAVISDAASFEDNRLNLSGAVSVGGTVEVSQLNGGIDVDSMPPDGVGGNMVGYNGASGLQTIFSPQENLQGAFLRSYGMYAGGTTQFFMGTVAPSSYWDTGSKGFDVVVGGQTARYMGRMHVPAGEGLYFFASGPIHGTVTWDFLDE